METADTESLSKSPERPRLAGILLAAGASQRLRATAAQASAPRKSVSTQKKVDLASIMAKQLLSFRGRPLLEHVIETIARANLDELIVVLGHEADAIEKAIRLPSAASSPLPSNAEVISPTESDASLRAARHDTQAHTTQKCDTSLGAQFCPVRFVRNPDYARGQSSSLRAGLNALSSEVQATAIFLGDQPGLKTATIDQLIENFFCLCAAKSAQQSATQQEAALAPLILRPLYAGFVDMPERGTAPLSPVPGHPVFFTRAAWENWEALQNLEGDQGARTIFASRPEWLHEVCVPVPAPCDIDTWADYQRVVDAAF